MKEPCHIYEQIMACNVLLLAPATKEPYKRDLYSAKETEEGKNEWQMRHIHLKKDA